MALSFGWRASEMRESIWKDDPALGAVPPAALDAWKEDGDRSHLEPYVKNGQPTIINFRPLTPDEKLLADGPIYAGGEATVEGYMRSVLLCFRMGVSFQDAEDTIEGPDREKHKLIVKEKGVRMLSEGVLADIEAKYPGMSFFYGKLIRDASFLTDAEKKASSPPSTVTPSSEAASTKAITEPSAKPEAASAVP